MFSSNQTAPTLVADESAFGRSVHHSLPTKVSSSDIYTDLLQHLQRFKRQCGMIEDSDVLLQKQFPLSLGWIAYEWYLTLHTITIPTWISMEERWWEQLTHWYNSKFLRCGRQKYKKIDHIPRDPVPNDQNDVNLGALTDNDENELSTSSNSKTWPENWNSGINLFVRSRQDRHMSLPRSPCWSLGEKNWRVKNQTPSTKNGPKRI